MVLIEESYKETTFDQESSICVQNTLERLDPQFTNYQFKLNVKQLMCGI